MPKHTSAYKRLTSKGALVRYAPRARLEEERKWHRTWRTEEDRLLQIQELAMDGFTLEQIDRNANQAALIEGWLDDLGQLASGKSLAM